MSDDLDRVKTWDDIEEGPLHPDDGAVAAMQKLRGQHGPMVYSAGIDYDSPAEVVETIALLASAVNGLGSALCRKAGMDPTLLKAQVEARTNELDMSFAAKFCKRGDK